MEIGSVNEGQAVKRESLLKRGSNIALVKRSLLLSQSSNINVGHALFGVNTADISVGQSVHLGSGHTSPVKGVTVNEVDGRIHLETQTSKYELLDKSFSGLNLDTPLGSVHLPVDSQLAAVDNNVVDLSVPTPNGDKRVYINKPALKGTLLETNSAQIFRSINGRFIILAKVGNIHLPFYISSRGTSGKNQGEWYPFFGYTGNWLIKGSTIGLNGEMEYHPEITKVADLLNQNLILPADSISDQGKMGPQIQNDEPSFVTFNLNNHLIYKKDESPHRDERETQFVANLTGYQPTNVTYENNASHAWIASIVANIK